MKQTAVEWLSEQLLNLDIEFDSMLINRANYWVKRNNILEQVKELEKEQQGYSEEEVLNFTQTIIQQYKFGNTNIEQLDLLKETLQLFKNK
jgi:hypothetical protein